MTDLSIEEIESSIKKAICSKVELEPKGVNRFLVHTGFCYQDGDELHILLKEISGKWMFTDEGHTLMWLSYEEFSMTDSRKAILQVTLSSNHATLEDGRIIIDCTGRDAGCCLLSMIQALLQTADMLYLSRTNVRNTYSEDVKDMMSSLLGDRCVFDKTINIENEKYSIDIYVDGPVPLYIFAIPNADRCKDALITILTLGTEAKMQFTTVIFMDPSADISKDNLIKLTNRTDKTFYSLPKFEVATFLKKTGIDCSEA